MAIGNSSSLMPTRLHAEGKICWGKGMGGERGGQKAAKELR